MAFTVCTFHCTCAKLQLQQLCILQSLVLKLVHFLTILCHYVERGCVITNSITNIYLSTGQANKAVPLQEAATISFVFLYEAPRTGSACLHHLLRQKVLLWCLNQ